MAVLKFTNSNGRLKQRLDYIMQEQKTGALLVSGHGCCPGTAFEEMMVTKKIHGKTGGRQYIHLVQSFAPGEVEPAQAHEIGRQLAARFSSFQSVTATHIDREHVHNHIILNSVNLETGLKFQQSKRDMQAVKDFSDELCRAAGLSVVKKKQPEKYRSMAECQQERKGNPTWRGILKQDIDEAIGHALTFKMFLEDMRRRGYEIKQGEHLAFKPAGGSRFIRLRSLGEGYAQQAIQRRIGASLSEYPTKPKPVARQYRGTWPPRKRIVGLTALTWHYVYLLRKLRHNPKQFHRYPVDRSELVKLERYQRQFVLLHKHKINTVAELGSFEQRTQQRIADLTERREGLHRQKKAADNPQPLLDEIKGINGQLRALRKDLRTAQGVRESTEHWRQERERFVQDKQERERQAQQKRPARPRLRLADLER